MTIYLTSSTCCVDDEAYMVKVRQYIGKKYSEASEIEQATMVGMFMMTEMSFKHFCNCMDALGLQMEMRMFSSEEKPKEPADKTVSSRETLISKLESAQHLPD